MRRVCAPCMRVSSLFSPRSPLSLLDVRLGWVIYGEHVHLSSPIGRLHQPLQIALSAPEYIQARQCRQIQLSRYISVRASSTSYEPGCPVRRLLVAPKSLPFGYRTLLKHGVRHIERFLSRDRFPKGKDNYLNFYGVKNQHKSLISAFY